MADRMDDYERVEIGSAGELRAWLADHYGRSESVWLVTSKKGRGPYVAYAEVVDELICYGWIDSVPRKLDEDRTMRLISPRKAGSNWSGVNKRKARALLKAERIAPPGLAAIEGAKRDGSWSALDGVERLEVPDDLAAALSALPHAADRFRRFPPSSRRGILEWIHNAKRDETRRRRIQETAEKAERNVKANHPKGRDAGPPLGEST